MSADEHYYRCYLHYDISFEIITILELACIVPLIAVVSKTPDIQSFSFQMEIN